MKVLFKNAAHHVIFLRGDKDLDFRQIAEVIDIARGAGDSRLTAVGLLRRYDGLTMIVPKPEPLLQEGDILMRPKESGHGFHFGTVVRTEAVVAPNALVGLYPKFLAAHTMPNRGKQPDTIEAFLDGKQGYRLRPKRTAAERARVEQNAVADFGRPYALSDNCETDTNRVQFGNPTSPTANRVGWALLIIGGLAWLGSRD